MKKYFLLLLTFWITILAFSQDYVGQKSFAGVSLGTLTYTGIYSKDASFISHTSMSGSLFYGHRLVIPKQLYIKGELMLGEIAGNNMNENESSNPFKGGFRGYLLEGSAKVEYELMDMYRYRISPYINAGAGAYYLFDYEPKQGDEKSISESIGFVMPVGGGVKYRLNRRVKIFAEGNYRFFAKNLDNFTDKTANNPNRYYSIVVGASFTLQKLNRLW